MVTPLLWITLLTDVSGTRGAGWVCQGMGSLPDTENIRYLHDCPYVRVPRDAFLCDWFRLPEAFVIMDKDVTSYVRMHAAHYNHILEWTHLLIQPNLIKNTRKGMPLGDICGLLERVLQ